MDEDYLCPECNEPYTRYSKWCQQCNAKRFQQDFYKWSSGNKFIDKFIQETQLNARYPSDILEWIPYNRLTNVKYLDKGEFSTIYKAIWLDGYIKNWDYDNQQWKRHVLEVSEDNNISKIKGYKVVLKNLDNSSNLNDEFLNEVILLTSQILFLLT